MEKAYPKIGVNVFVLKNGKLLIGKRVGERGYGTWCLPGGHFEIGESLKDAAARELEEETSIRSNDLQFLHLVNDPRSDSHYVHIGFFANNFEGEPKVTEPEKFAEWKWFDLNNLPEPIFDGHQKLILAFIQKINFQDNNLEK